MAPWNNHGHYFGDFTVDGTRYRPPLRDRKGRTIPADPDHWEEAVRRNAREPKPRRVNYRLVGKVSRGSR